MIKVITAFFEGPERECSKCIKRPENGFANANASTPVATAVDIKAKYNAKCGTPSAGSPKVFFKYFFVNTVTGEKSEDVLAQAKLTNE